MIIHLGGGDAVVDPVCGLLVRRGKGIEFHSVLDMDAGLNHYLPLESDWYNNIIL